MRLMLYLLGPLLTVVEAIVRVLMRALGIKIGANQPLLSPTERLRGAVDLLTTRARSKSRTATCSAAC
jgi:Putative Mg2+ and Co2+ transporter CorB